MAEEDPEIALLHQLQAGQESVTWDDGGANGATEGEQPSNIEDNNQQEQTVADDQVQRALSPSGSGAVADTPLLAVTMAGDEQSRSSSRASARKPRTVGGFIADDSDDEGDSSPTPGGVIGLQVPTPSRISPSPLHSVTNSETTSPASALPVKPIAVQATVQGAASILPKARLPHDRMGILEDRIKEDPKGDIDAWLSLITEYRSRHKLDEARAVYERFFQVFPQAVSKFCI